MEMTSTHGILLAAIGLAMFAILAVVWVLRRAQSVRAAIRNFRIVQEPPAPYASPITGSRPVNPYVTREELAKTLDCIHDEMLDHQGWTHEIHQRVERLEDDARHEDERC